MLLSGTFLDGGLVHFWMAVDKKWMNNFLKLLFMLKIALILHALAYTKNTQREKYLALFLMVLKLW